MEPRIQYARTSDGVSIAFWTMGDGPPLVFLPPFLFGSCSLELEGGRWLAFYQTLASSHRLIRLDLRGSGLSDKEGEPASFDEYARDILAVADHLGLTQFAAFAPNSAGPLGIAFASRHKERLTHLILWCARERLFDDNSSLAAFQSLIARDWEAFTEATTHQIMGWNEPEEAQRLASYVRAATTAEDFYRLVSSAGGLDVTERLQDVRTPTLVMMRRESRPGAPDRGRFLSSRIPNAQLVTLEGSSLAPYMGDVDALLNAMGSFLGTTFRPFASPSQPSAATTSTILFTDLASSTALTQRLGDERAQTLVRAHDAIVREALAARDGSEIKHTGDGIMASFPTASGAVACAIQIQRAVAEARDPDLQVYIGLNAGEPVSEEKDLFGASVQLAARLCDLASPGQILVSNVVRELAAGKGFSFIDCGEASLKGFEEPVRVFEVRWRED